LTAEDRPSVAGKGDVGNYSDSDFSILRVDGTKVTDTGKHFKVPGQPGAARMSPH
jgi:hypothetical protein